MRFPVRKAAGIFTILCNDKPTLVWVTNLGDIEKHVLLARAPHIDCPTSLVFDLDPGEPADILDCCRVALHLNEVFQSLGLKCFAKVSGSKGLHLAVPLNTKTTYEITQSFAKTIAELGERQLPDRVVSDMSRSSAAERFSSIGVRTLTLKRPLRFTRCGRSTVGLLFRCPSLGMSCPER